MVPTNHLRFVERELPTDQVYINTKSQITKRLQKVRVLQQWWEDRSCDVYVAGTPSGSPGVWKDVPLGEEK